MRIENDRSLRGLTLTGFTATFLAVLGILICASFSVYAADAAAPSATLPVPTEQGAAAPAPSPTNPVKIQGSEIQKSVSEMEDKVSDNANNVVKHLETSGDTTTFSDLNSARQTVTRIEALIEVEKHLAELEKLRNDRGDGSHHASAALSSAIPASALTPPPQARFVSERPALEASSPSPSHGHAEISRIYGTDGKYTALLKLSNGETKSVRVGDQLSNGEVVSLISASSVGIQGQGASYTLHIKNVDAIYSAMR